MGAAAELEVDPKSSPFHSHVSSTGGLRVRGVTLPLQREHFQALLQSHRHNTKACC